MEKLNKNPSIFIVDDDKFLIDMYALKFSEKSFRVETATSGIEALDRLVAGYRPAVILLDIIMPGVNGFQVLEKIKKDRLGGSPVVVILSNLGQKEDVDKGLYLGADDYIVKANLTPSEVVAKTIEIFNKKKKS